MKPIQLFCIAFALLLWNCANKSTDDIAVNVSISESLNTESLDGRLLLMFADNDEQEPRFQVTEGLNAQPVFGINVESFSSDNTMQFNNEAFGFPYKNLSQIKPGDYYVQALLHTYETFNLSTGHQVKLPMDNGEGQRWRISPGNLYSIPKKITITEQGIENFDIVLDQMLSLIHI